MQKFKDGKKVRKKAKRKEECKMERRTTEGKEGCGWK